MGAHRTQVLNGEDFKVKRFGSISKMNYKETCFMITHALAPYLILIFWPQPGIFLIYVRPLRSIRHLKKNKGMSKKLFSMRMKSSVLSFISWIYEGVWLNRLLWLVQALKNAKPLKRRLPLINDLITISCVLTRKMASYWSMRSLVESLVLYQFHRKVKNLVHFSFHCSAAKGLVRQCLAVGTMSSLVSPRVRITDSQFIG